MRVNVRSSNWYTIRGTEHKNKLATYQHIIEYYPVLPTKIDKHITARYIPLCSKKLRQEVTNHKCRKDAYIIMGHSKSALLFFEKRILLNSNSLGRGILAVP